MRVLFFFNDTATTEIYTLSLHDALPIWRCVRTVRAPWSAPSSSRSPARRSSARPCAGSAGDRSGRPSARHTRRRTRPRSEEHTSELQSRQYLVCRLLLEKKKHTTYADDE